MNFLFSFFSVAVSFIIQADYMQVKGQIMPTQHADFCENSFLIVRVFLFMSEDNKGTVNAAALKVY